MQVQVPIFILCLLVHGSIYLTSERRDRRGRLIAGLLVLFSTWLFWAGGLQLDDSETTALRWLGLAFAKSPYYMPFLSFFVYLRRQARLSRD